MNPYLYTLRRELERRAELEPETLSEEEWKELGREPPPKKEPPPYYG